MSLRSSGVPVVVLPPEEAASKVRFNDKPAELPKILLIIPEQQKPILKRRPEDHQAILRKRALKELDKAKAKENPEKVRPDALPDEAKKVKRIRKARGQFRELPKDGVMAVAGPGVLDQYKHLYNRRHAPQPFMEGEEPDHPGRMTIHAGMGKLLADLHAACCPSGRSHILTATLLQHWFATISTTTSTRANLVARMLLDDLASDVGAHS